MRVIKAEKPEIECTCPNCKSVLAVDKSDIVKNVGKDYTGSTDIRYSALCPICDTRFEINMNHIPFGWQ
jgi:transcription elongation factor Elf1